MQIFVGHLLKGNNLSLLGCEILFLRYEIEKEIKSGLCVTHVSFNLCRFSKINTEVKENI